jgi:hypothetical protein
MKPVRQTHPNLAIKYYSLLSILRPLDTIAEVVGFHAWQAIGSTPVVRLGEGFRMPASGDLSGPASESPPGRNPRGAVWAVAVYGDLTGRRLG